MIREPPRSALFPNTPLFRSLVGQREPLAEELRAVATSAGMTDHRAVAHWLLFLSAAGRTDLVAARRHADTAVALAEDRKSTRLNSSHANISYAVFCLKQQNS